MDVAQAQCTVLVTVYQNAAPGVKFAIYAFCFVKYANLLVFFFVGKSEK